MTDQKWPGYGQDGEAARLEQERQRAEQIKADNLSARIRAADPAQRTAIDPATGRTFADAVARGLYDDDARTRQFRETAERNRQARAEVQRDIDRRAGRLAALGRGGMQAVARDQRDRPAGQPRGTVPPRPQPDRGGPLGRADTLARALERTAARDQQARLQGRRGRN